MWAFDHLAELLKEGRGPPIEVARIDVPTFMQHFDFHFSTSNIDDVVEGRVMDALGCHDQLVKSCFTDSMERVPHQVMILSDIVALLQRATLLQPVADKQRQ